MLNHIFNNARKAIHCGVSKAKKKFTLKFDENVHFECKLPASISWPVYQVDASRARDPIPRKRLNVWAVSLDEIKQAVNSARDEARLVQSNAFT